MHDFGNKAKNLRVLQNAGINVPKFASLPSDSRIEDVIALVSSTFNSDDLLAVRSSAEVEDGENQSFAGAFRSEVAIRIDEVPKAWELVKDSLPPGNNGIILQEMVFGDFSGVCFSDHKKDRCIINALPGLCRAVVEGFDADQFELENGQLVFEHIPQNREAMVFENKEIVQKPSQDRLTDLDIKKIEEACKACSKLMSAPQDVEWTIRKGEVIILQSRPITADPWKERDVKLFDSANVGESYGGIVLPLTMTFARKLYSQVYTDLLRKSGVSQRVLSSEAQTFDNLVDSAYGRMYYRMENWYRFMSLLPGYSRNKQNLENMLMLNIREAQRDIAKPSLRLKMLYYPLVIAKLLRFGSTMKSFEKEVLALLKKAHSWPIRSMNEGEVMQKIDFLFDGILRRWYLTIENDTVMMTLFARLSDPQSGVDQKQLLSFHSVSTEQVNELVKLSKMIISEPRLREAVKSADSTRFVEELKEHKSISDQYDNYRVVYGGRFANELKLETPDLDDSFTQFSQVLERFANMEERETFKSAAESTRLMRVFHRFAERREQFRLHRASMFAIVRKLVWRLGELKVKDGTLERPEDIFYVEWDELRAKTASWKQKVSTRRAEYQFFRRMEPPAFFKVSNGRWPSIAREDAGDRVLSGIGASNGKVSARATVLEHFDIPAQEEIGVLVTKRTDPGWTTIMALSQGLVVEHGGMLSHASIVARELNLPAVIGLKDACKRIKDGELISVDGDQGIVTKLEGDEIDH